MSAFGGQLPSLVALAAHAAICVTGVSVVGATALWICRERSAPLRHALALSFLAATLAIPAIAALYQYRLIRFSFARAPQAPAVTDTSPLRETGSAAAPIEEELTGTASPNTVRNWSFVACAAFGLVWVAGCAAGCVRMLRLNHRQRQYLEPLRPVASVAALELVDRLRQALGIRRPVQLLSSRDSPWPFTVGLFRPRVIIPGDLLHESSHSRLESVLLHELAHVRRCDCGIAAIEELSRLVYWWNPLVSMLTSHLAAAREEICDGYVLAHAGDGASLADYLLCSAEKAAHAQLRFAVGLSWHDPLSLRRRITQLLAGDRNTMIRISSLAAFTLTLAIISLASVFTHSNYAWAELTFHAPVPLGNSVNTSIHWESGPTLTGDELNIVFSRRELPIFLLYEARRESITDPFGTATPLSAVVNLDGTSQSVHPSLSTDGLTLFFQSERAGGYGFRDLYQATRASRGSEWGNVTNLGPLVNTAGLEAGAEISADGLTLYFKREDDIYVARRNSVTEQWSDVQALPAIINTPFDEGHPSISTDGTLLFFESTRPGGFGSSDLYVATRTSPTDPWESVQNLGPLINTVSEDKTPEISLDGSRLYFESLNRPGGPGGRDIWVAQVVPEPSAMALGGTCCIILVGCVLARGLRVRFKP